MEKEKVVEESKKERVVAAALLFVTLVDLENNLIPVLVLPL